MTILNTFFINSKKLKHQTGKALFLIVPIIALVTLSIVVSSQVTNFKDATNDVVFGTIEEQSRLIELDVEISVDENDPRSFFAAQETTFSEADLSNIETIDNVEAASINSPLPITNIKTEDAFEGISYTIPELIGMDSSIATLYTESDFTYVEGEPIPIILNAATFIESYEDWDGEDTFTIDFEEIRGRGQGGPGKGMSVETPIKTKAIEFDESELIGREITIQFGSLDEIATIATERTDTGIVMTKLTEVEIQEQEEERRDALNNYWDVDALNTPISYTFKVVDIVEDETSRAAYVPTQFANVVTQSWIENQLDARNETNIPVEDLDLTYTGLTYDGLELSSQSGFGRGIGSFGGTRPGQSGESTASYRIPGLVIELTDDGTEEVIGVYESTNVYEESVKTGRTIIIKTSSFFDRSQVIEDLNEMGYAYQDLSNLEAISELEKALYTVRTGLVISFIVLTIAIIIITMSKFVSDSTKEIGIFRAMGVTKGGIFTLFILQSLLYTLVGYGLGIGIGILTNIGLSGIVNGWFDSIVVSSIEESYNVVHSVETSIFTHIDWSSVGIFSGLLFLVVLVISLIPAIKASSVSPVEAMKE